MRSESSIDEIENFISFTGKSLSELIDMEKSLESLVGKKSLQSILLYKAIKWRKIKKSVYAKETND